jgi:hypothetical protein
MAAHGLQQPHRAGDVHVPVAQRLGHRFAHGLEASEVEHGADASAKVRGFEGSIEIRRRAHITPEQGETAAPRLRP